MVGDFNQWDGRVNPMISHAQSGVWELFIPDMAESSLYKYEIRNRFTGEILLKTDPMRIIMNCVRITRHEYHLSRIILTGRIVTG